MSEQQTLSRRTFLKMGGGITAGAGVAVVGLAPATAEAAVSTGVTLPYKPKTVARVKVMKVNQPVAFNYPDAASPCQAVKMGAPVAGGMVCMAMWRATIPDSSH